MSATVDREALVAEFTDVIGLEAVDAYRAAFTALALSRGWTKARVARYLGITRQRVNQKVDKLEHYVDAHEVPVLAAVMQQVAGTKPRRRESDDLVRYESSDWADIEFARSLLDIVSR